MADSVGSQPQPKRRKWDLPAPGANVVDAIEPGSVTQNIVQPVPANGSGSKWDMQGPSAPVAAPSSRFGAPVYPMQASQQPAYNLQAYGLVAPPGMAVAAARSAGTLDNNTIKALQAQAAAVVSRFSPVRIEKVLPSPSSWCACHSHRSKDISMYAHLQKKSGRACN